MCSEAVLSHMCSSKLFCLTCARLSCSVPHVLVSAVLSHMCLSRLFCLTCACLGCSVSRVLVSAVLSHMCSEAVLSHMCSEAALCVAVEHNWCAIVPLSYILPQPILLMLASIKTSQSVSMVWFMWSKFFPAYMYCMVLFWPAILYHVNILSHVQYVTSASASVFIVLGARLFLQALPHTGYTQVAVGANEFYMY